jgi:Uma2 family endonuclease
MEWQEICDSPLFRDLPFKVETNRWGHIEMTPASNEHGLYQAQLVERLAALGRGGHPITECSVQTSAGVKVADVAWASNEFFRLYGRANPYPAAPEIVIEILSPSNTEAEMAEKKELYFARGAREFWTCAKSGGLRFCDNRQELAGSRIIPGFPAQVNIDFA